VNGIVANLIAFIWRCVFLSAIEFVGNYGGDNISNAAIREPMALVESAGIVATEAAMAIQHSAWASH
jgi:hypothetical protein